MARTFSGTERSRVSGSQLDVYGKLEITGPDGAWIDVSADLDTPDWFNSATLTENIDTLCATFSAQLLMTKGALSLAPLMTASTLNRDFGGVIAGTGANGSFTRTSGTWTVDAMIGKTASIYAGGGGLVGAFTVTDNDATSLTFVGDATTGVSLNTYGPMLDVARQWRLSMAVTARGVAADPADWKELGTGYLDTVDVGGDGTTLQITGRDLGAKLLDHYITCTNTYGSSAGVPMETVLQAILDDNLGSAAPTLYTPVSPSFVISPATYPPEGNLLEALNAVAALAGFVVRYRYDAADVSRLTLYCPDRTSTAGDEDWTVAATEYLALPVARLDLSGVRNFIEVSYVELPGGATRTARSPAGGSSTSITRYGRRYMGIDLAQSSQINTATRAQAFVDAICADLQTPALEQRFETFGFWFVQLGDYGKFTHNDVHYDTDQYGGVTGITHVFANGTVRSVVDVRGQPAGAYRNWLTLTGGLPGVAPFTITSPRTKPATAIIYEVTFGEGCAYVEFFTRLHAAASGANPLETDVDLAGRLMRPATGVTASFRIATTASYYRRTFAVGYTASGERGTVTAVLEDQAAAADTPTTAPTISAHTDYATSVAVTVDHNGITTGTVRLYVNSTLWVEDANAGGASQVVTAVGLSAGTTYSITATQVVAGVESAASSPLSTTTSSETLDAPTSWHAAGSSGDPKMRFYWACGSNAGGASVTIEESATGAWAGEEASVVFAPSGLTETDAGATNAGSNAHSSGSHYFRAKAVQTGYTDSAWTADEFATYGGDDA